MIWNWGDRLLCLLVAAALVRSLVNSKNINSYVVKWAHFMAIDVPTIKADTVMMFFINFLYHGACAMMGQVLRVDIESVLLMEIIAQAIA